MSDERVTAVVTSCGRQDLLDIALGSFLEKNTHPHTDIIVVEDGSWRRNRRLSARYAGKPIAWVATGKWVGQVRSIDLAYARVTAPYIFHMEDDWEFLAGGFIEKSLEILKRNPDCLQVHIRGPADLNDHPLQPDVEYAGTIPFRRLVKDFCGAPPADQNLRWHGFSFNPGLRRLSDYLLLKPFVARILSPPGNATSAEAEIGELYYAKGFYSAVLVDNGGRGYVRHIGERRHVFEPARSRIARLAKRLAGIRR